MPSDGLRFVVWGFCGRSEEEWLDLEAQKMMQKLQSLWDAGTAVTFGLICPPSSNDKISALATFDLLLRKWLTEFKILFINKEETFSAIISA